MKRALTSLVIFSFMITLLDCSGPIQQKSLESSIDSLFGKYNNGGPGCAIAIIKDGQVILSKGYGLANLEYGIPITPTSIFDIASVSKQFAGLAIATLVDQGKISLEDDIHKYLPEVPDFGKKITINHLVHHTSGLRDWPGTLRDAGWRWDETFSFDDIMRMVKYQKDLSFGPGDQHSYSNTGYNLLARIVEKVTGTSFREWTDANIFTPLAMNNSHFLDDHRKIIPNLAYSYGTVTDSTWRKSPTGLTAYGSSSLFTSLEDLCKWVIHFDKQLTSGNKIYTGMLEKGVLNNGEKVDYAFGLALGKSGSLSTIDHTGGWAGYRTIIMNFPDQHTSFIALGNVGNFNPSGAAESMARIVLKDVYKEEAPDAVKGLPTIQIAPPLAEKYLGSFRLDEGWFVTFTWENNTLMVQASGESKFPTQAKSDSVFWVDAYSSAFTFSTDKDGNVSKLRYRDMIAPRITPKSVDPGRYGIYSGSYFSEELVTKYWVDASEGKLMMHHMRHGDFELSPDLEQADVFHGLVGTVRFSVVNGKVKGLQISDGRNKGLQFGKMDGPFH